MRGPSGRPFNKAGTGPISTVCFGVVFFSSPFWGGCVCSYVPTATDGADYANFLERTLAYSVAGIALVERSETDHTPFLSGYSLCARQHHHNTRNHI